MLLGAGSAMVRPVAAGTAPESNAVSAFGDAPDHGPSSGLSLVSPVLGIAATPTGDGYWLVAGDGGIFSFGDAAFHGSTGGLRLAAPIVGMAPTPSGDGYWLVARDGGIFSFGDAAFHGSTGGLRLAAPIVAMAPTHSGDGYWLVARDGGVFALGDAGFYGSAGTVPLSEPIVAIAATPTGGGYWLLARDGGVFAFGDAAFSGSAAGLDADAVGIARDPDGSGYWIATAGGSVQAFDAEDSGAVDAAAAAFVGVPTVGIAARQGGGYWLAHGDRPRVEPDRVDPNHPFLVCTRAHESDTSGGYRAVSSSGTYRGAYQFSRSTWDNTARHAGRPDLVGVDPAAAAPHDQDFLALDLYRWQGASPWGGRCAGL